MKRVLLVARTTGYQIRSFGQAAESLGVRLVFASDRCDRLEDPWWDQAIPVRFHEESRSVEAVVRACGAAPPDGILAVGDRPVVLAALLAQAFGLPGPSPRAAEISRNKRLTRETLRDAGLPTPWFDVLSLDSDAKETIRRVRYPAVLKPLALAGSRGVMRVDDEAALSEALSRLRELVSAPDIRAEREDVHREALVEGFIPGAEYAVEGLFDRGRFQLLALFDKPDPLDGPFFEETIYVTPSAASPEVQDSIARHVERAARAIGLCHGPIHAECRVNDSGVWILEVAARPIGGLCARALRFGAEGEASEISLEALLLRHAIGEPVTGLAREREASGVMMIPIPRKGVYRRVEGVDEARRIDGVTDVQITAKPDVTLLPLPEGRSYLGFIFARKMHARDVEAALRAAHARLHFVIDRELTLVRS